MAENVLIKTSILIFGYLFGSRILKTGIEKYNVTSKHVFRMKMVVIFLMITAYCVSSDTLFLFWSTMFWVLSGTAVTIFVTFRRNQKKFRQDFVFFVDRVLIQMKMGKSLRSAVDISVQSASPASQKTLIQIVELVFREGDLRSSHAFHQEILEEMRVWAGLQAKVVKRIQSYRTKLRLEEKFRHKSEQILHQIRIQMVLIAVMYVGMALFLATRFDFSKHIISYLLSFLLFVVGLVSFQLIAQRRTWKI